MERQYILFSTGLALIAFILLVGFCMLALLLVLWRIPYGYLILMILALATAVVHYQIDGMVLRRRRQSKRRTFS